MTTETRGERTARELRIDTLEREGAGLREVIAQLRDELTKRDKQIDQLKETLAKKQEEEYAALIKPMEEKGARLTSELREAQRLAEIAWKHVRAREDRRSEE